MFEQFTDRARRVVVLAQEQSRLLNHTYIGTEHILLGLLQEKEGVAARALESLGMRIEDVEDAVEQIIGAGQTKPAGSIPFTSRAKKVLELSLREAMQLGHDYIGTEHILLGLIREEEGVAAQVLLKLGLSLEDARAAVMELLAGDPTVVGRARVSRKIRARKVQGPGCLSCSKPLIETLKTAEIEREGRKFLAAYCDACGATQELFLLD